ncbi:MAG: MMPL family transporter [Aureispira sp.]|nr:MMPL family transporter [Aureispira sp.]
MFVKYPKIVISSFVLLSVLGLYMAYNRVSFSFDFEQFFPTGDPDLEFYYEFKQRFEPDDNFLLVALKREEGVFEQDFLKKVEAFSEEVKTLDTKVTQGDLAVIRRDSFIFNKVYIDYAPDWKDSVEHIQPVLSVQSIISFQYPVKNPFTGFTTIPAVHIDKPEKYEKDKKRILSDERFVNTLISEDAKTMVVALKTIDNIPQGIAERFIKELNIILDKYEFEEHHLLGRANFQTELVRLQMWEFTMSFTVSSLLVLLVMFLIFRTFWGVNIALSSIGVGLAMFVGYLGLVGATLDTMALLYPIIMIIVATSDVVHVMSKYIDELRKGQDKQTAIQITIQEIGVSIFLTSTTTAIGFLSLVTSKLGPIRALGIHAAVGVMIAYVSVIIFTTTILALFSEKQIMKEGRKESSWGRWMGKMHEFTRNQSFKISAGFLGLFLLCGIGVSMVNTNTQIEQILPRGAEVTADFHFFEEEFSGFRPFEIAISLKDSNTTDDFKVVQQIDKLENFIIGYDAIKTSNSITAVYKTINRAYKGNKLEAYVLPNSEKQFKKYQRLAKNLGGGNSLGVLVSRDKKYARVSARVLDVGADSVRNIIQSVDKWAKTNIDTNMMEIRQTGTGVIVDKNSEYVKDSLLQGLVSAILLISLLMALLFRSFKMLFIALIPNVLPLLIAAAILGFTGIPLEAGVSIVFAIIFGIAVDDTIHLLSKYRLMRKKDIDKEEAIKLTLIETGKAISLTTVILFFGFILLIFSSNPPAVTIGLLISSTLVTALVCDLLIIPVMLRWWGK